MPWGGATCFSSTNENVLTATAQTARRLRVGNVRVPAKCRDAATGLTVADGIIKLDAIASVFRTVSRQVLRRRPGSLVAVRRSRGCLRSARSLAASLWRLGLRSCGPVRLRSSHAFSGSDDLVHWTDLDSGVFVSLGNAGNVDPEIVDPEIDLDHGYLDDLDQHLDSEETNTSDSNSDHDSGAL